MTTSKKIKEKNSQVKSVFIKVIEKDAGFSLLAIILLLIPIVLLYLPWVNKYFTILVILYIMIWAYLLRRHWNKIGKEILKEREEDEKIK